MKRWHYYNVVHPQWGRFRIELDEDEYPTPEAREEYCRREYQSYVYVGSMTEPQMGEPVVCDGEEYSTEAYQEMFGKISFPEGFEEKLRERDLAGQMDLYRITEDSTLAKTAYGEVTGSKGFEHSRRLQDYRGLVDLIIKDGIIVGVRIKVWPEGTAPLLPGKSVCTYYASDNEGSGTDEREDRAWLICV